MNRIVILVVLALISGQVLPGSSAEAQAPKAPAAPAAAPSTGSAAEAGKPDEEPLEEAEVLVGGPNLPSYFVVSAFLRRAALVLERPIGQRPDFFTTFGCTLGNERYQACFDLINEGAKINNRTPNSKTPEESQAALDTQAREIAQVYAKLLKLLGATPEAARGWHTKVEEVRPTVGMVLTDEPGQDLFQAARIFDQELEKLYPGALQLPGFVLAKSAPPSGG